MCSFCKGDTMVNSTTAHVVVLPKCIIIAMTVPCLECSQCREKYYTAEISRMLEKTVKEAKKVRSQTASPLHK